MAQNASPRQQYAQSPAVAAIKYDAGVGPEPHKVMMERTFSQDIQEGTQELKEAAEQTRNMILDLGLDGVIRWVSPSWTDVVGTHLAAVKGTPIKQYIDDDPNVFERAVTSLKSNDSKSIFVKFTISTRHHSELGPMVESTTDADEAKSSSSLEEKDHDEKVSIELEGQGIMVYDRVSGEASHTMWMLQPAAEPVHIEIELPKVLVDLLGVGAEVLAKYLSELTESGAQDPAHHPPPLPEVCRVCERSIVPWWFERHSDLCVQEHKAELEVQMVQESLTEHRHAIVKVLDAFEARASRASGPDSVQPVVEYQGLTIGSTASSSLSSTVASQTVSPARSRSPSIGANHTRARSSFIPRRPLVRVVELILDLCDTAIEINIPSIKDSKNDGEDDFRTQSPQSDSRISQVLSWQPPSSLENEPGLAALSNDTERLTRAKVEAVHRHQVILEYAERIRQEYMAEVDSCIAEALRKAERAAAGEPVSSSESECESHSEIEESEGEDTERIEPTLLSEEPISPIEEPLPELEVPRSQSRPQLRSLASALRNPHDLPVVCLDRRPSSQAVSTGSSSPQECPTPKSSRSTLVQPQPIHKRQSFYGAQEEAEQSDGSLPSVSATLYSRRTESPAPMSEAGLSRSTSTRDRKRRSMHLHGLNSASPHRGSSPGRYPPAPASPLRITKGRNPSGETSAPSPIVSPLLTMGEFPPSPQYNPVHRRQSSIHSSDPRAPLSPRLGTVHPPSQPKALPPSIKDFEIVKPISRGAFGSVYLAKKKLTGEYFAMKVLRKSDMVAKNQVTNVKAERAIMMWQGESDFVAKLYWTFSSKDYLFLVMEYLNGGDCASLVKILGGLTEDWAKKYIAEVVLGVEHLHSRGIVHRDLKPDNLLIDSKGHLKLTDFGLSRMGLVGRQKRALKSPEELDAEFIKQKQVTSQIAEPSSRHASFDYPASRSPSQTPLMTPALTGGTDQPSYFTLNREASLSRDWSRRASGYRSDSGSVSSHDLHHVFQGLSLGDNFDYSNSRPSSMYFKQSIEEETQSQGSNSPDLFPLSQSISNISQSANAYSTQMLPPPTALFDPEETSKRFVGTPDYLAPETITGTVQDEMCDWWSLGCILFEFLYGVPPFNAPTTEEVFDNILHRRIAWPEDEDYPEVSPEAKDLINRLIQLSPKERLGANHEDKFPSGGAEIRAHSWFADINWSTLFEDEAQFVPNPENPEDTEYFDARGATLQSFPEELEDQISPAAGPDYQHEDRPHDALFKARSQVIGAKRGLMPLAIPAHIARDSRSRRLSEPVIADDFGNFTYKNLPVLEKANKDIVEKMRKEAMQAQARFAQGASQPASTVSTPIVPSPVPSVDSSPIPMTVKRALSVNKHHRTASPSGFSGGMSMPSRSSQPGSPMLVQFSTGQHHHERRKTSGSSTASNLHTQMSFESDTATGTSAASSPVKRMSTISPAKTSNNNLQPTVTGRNRSHTVGSQDSESPLREPFIPGHHKRRSALLHTQELSPSSSDNENMANAKALLKVHRKRQSSRRMSQAILFDQPCYRPLDVLICEDNPVSRMVMERLFEKMRCRTVTATTGAQALSYAVSSIHFDIIFTEFKLPDQINGVDVARMIRDTKSANSTTPIVCMTGYLKDLPEVHRFDTLLQKPPTIEKLTEALCKYCEWKPPPKDFKSIPLSIIPPPPIQQAHNSPSSVASSRAPTMPDSSYKGSSREDSVSSGGFFSDMESLKADDVPNVVLSRKATGDWNGDGLGISEDSMMTRQDPIQSEISGLPISVSAPSDVAGDVFFPLLRLRPSQEAIRIKRESIEKHRITIGGAEEGDDEDEELGHHHHSRQRSPRTGSKSKLGHEMMRTNSRGSIVCLENQIAEPDNLRRSLEMLEERMESMRIPEERITDLSITQPRKEYQSSFHHSHPDPAHRPGSGHGHITPPIMFPREPGHTIKNIDMVENEVDSDPTPMPNRTFALHLPFDETTPRATSENGSTVTPKPRSIAEITEHIHDDPVPESAADVGAKFREMAQLTPLPDSPEHYRQYDSTASNLDRLIQESTSAEISPMTTVIEKRTPSVYESVTMKREGE